ncbi:aldehyde dehydrogenase family protein [Streptomyces sp. NPDC012935]|uniref:aldehyde dehydrogenase family protein n=1 Tax=Streptomyces sp. NPDC012935 TaxID=3364857 RepID=UPI0036801F4C
MHALPHALMHIDGKWTDTTARYEIRNPATEEVVATMAKGSREHADQAVAAAKAAYEEGSWRETPPRERAAVLRQAADRLALRSEELVEMQVRENGAPVRLAEALHIGTSLAHLRYQADLAERYRFERPSEMISPVLAAGLIRREPIGVCAGIVPWNFPLVHAAWKIAPALAAGNTIVIKPDERAPLTVIELVRELAAAGLPPGVLNLVTGDGPEVGGRLVEHPHVRKISFTGSTQVGRDVVRRAAGDFKHLTLELGGKSANIVLADADVKTAVDGALFAGMAYSGQICAAGSRLLLPEALHDAFVEQLIARMRTLRISDPSDPLTDIGPLISRERRDHVLTCVTGARDQGARIAHGGRIPSGARFTRGHWVEPTVITGVTADMRIAHEEVFGPVLAVMRYRTVEEAVRIANGTQYGLAAGVWSRDNQAALDVAAQLESGVVWINDWYALPPHFPLGGCKQSGLGRESGEHSLDEYTQEKAVTVDLSGGLEGKLYSLLLGTESP